MARRKKKAPEIRVRLRHGQDDRLLTWLEQFDGQPYGLKSQAVKQALLRGIDEGTSQESAGSLTVDLAEIRQVVESAVAAQLARLGAQVNLVDTATEETDEVEALLNELGGLVLDDD